MSQVATVRFVPICGSTEDEYTTDTIHEAMSTAGWTQQGTLVWTRDIVAQKKWLSNMRVHIYEAHVPLPEAVESLRDYCDDCGPTIRVTISEKMALP